MNPPAAAAGPLNEEHVRQAVVFLSDARVKAADPARAAHFLRQKLIPERELREAFKRCGIPFPHEPTAGQVAAWGQPPPMQYFAHPPPPPARSPWMSALYSITAIVGAYAVLREVLKRYVIPVYFPELAGSESADVIKRQERQIESLRETVQELRQASRETSAKVDRLSLTVSSTGFHRELPASDATELRDAIRQLSQSVSESSPASRSVIGRLQELRGEVDHLRLLSVGKETKGGSLAYTGRVEESAAHSATPSRDGLDTPMFTAPNTQRRPPSNRVSDNRSSVGGVNGGRRKAIDEEDAFMAVRPAEVEEGWGTKSAAGDTVVNDKENEGHVQMGNVAARAAALEEASKSNSEADAPSADADEIAKGRPEETEALATTRRLFQQSMFEEAEKSEGTLDEPDRNHRRSIMSAPDLELPLSDSDM